MRGTVLDVRWIAEWLSKSKPVGHSIRETHIVNTEDKPYNLQADDGEPDVLEWSEYEITLLVRVENGG